MTRFAIDAAVALRLAQENVALPAEHQLVAPTLLRSQVLSELYREVRQGVRAEKEARQLLDRVTTMKIRLLGDRVSRSVAWQIAGQLNWNDTADAEYIAVAKLQADFFVTMNAELASRVECIVRTAPFEMLIAPH